MSRAPIVSPDLAVLEEVAGGEGLITFPSDGDAATVADAVERGLATEAGRLRRRVLTRHDWPAVIARTLTTLPSPEPRETPA